MPFEPLSGAAAGRVREIGCERVIRFLFKTLTQDADRPLIIMSLQAIGQVATSEDQRSRASAFIDSNLSTSDRAPTPWERYDQILAAALAALLALATPHTNQPRASPSKEPHLSSPSKEPPLSSPSKDGLLPPWDKDGLFSGTPGKESLFPGTPGRDGLHLMAQQEAVDHAATRQRLVTRCCRVICGWGVGGQGIRLAATEVLQTLRALGEPLDGAEARLVGTLDENKGGGSSAMAAPTHARRAAAIALGRVGARSSLALAIALSRAL
ncbi:hypothetical protein T484DRAFT_1898712, partial [Baffinella frigidus]